MESVDENLDVLAAARQTETPGSTWSSPRLMGKGSHRSVSSVIQECFVAYMYDRRFESYHTEMIKAADKTQLGGHKMQMNVKKNKTCDGKPWAMFGARGYTATSYDRDADGTRLTEPEQNWEPKSPNSSPDEGFCQVSEAHLMFLLMAGFVKLPAVSRAYVSIGTRLLMNGHPEGPAVLEGVKDIAVLHLGVSSREKTTSGIVLPRLKVSVGEIKSRQIAMAATRLQRQIRTTDEQELLLFMSELGYSAEDARPICVQLAVEASAARSAQACVAEFSAKLESVSPQVAGTALERLRASMLRHNSASEPEP